MPVFPKKVSSLSCSDKAESFIEPSGDAAYHLFNRSSKPGQPNCRFLGAIAVRPRAIYHEQGVRWIFVKAFRIYAWMRQIDRVFDVAGVVKFLAGELFYGVKGIKLHDGDELDLASQRSS